MPDNNTATATNEVRLLCAKNKADLKTVLHDVLVTSCSSALDRRGRFVVALSGGSLPGLLRDLEGSFAARNIDPRFDVWDVVLADERRVPSDHADSNYRALKENLPASVGALRGLDPSVPLEDGVAQAAAYERALTEATSDDDGVVDCAILGFGPDGHTCSLFPGHALLSSSADATARVAHIDDSPKPPPQRITLTMNYVNSFVRDAVVCGAGASKNPVLAEIVRGSAFVSGIEYRATMDATRYPCAMVNPTRDGGSCTWIVDEAATDGLLASPEKKEE